MIVHVEGTAKARCYRSLLFSHVVIAASIKEVIYPVSNNSTAHMLLRCNFFFFPQASPLN
jgi:hypothetical protein